MENIDIVLEKLSTKLGVATSHLWEVLTAQAHIQAVKYFIGLCIWACLTMTTRA